MKPFYSIQEIANLLNWDVPETCSALVASKVDCYFNGKTVDLTKYRCFEPKCSDGPIFVRTGGAQVREPTPDTTLVLAESLPISWIKCFESTDGRAVLELERANRRIAELEDELSAKGQSEVHVMTAGTVDNGVTVVLPHMTKALAAVFKIMRNNWSKYEATRLPKQTNIAREIDAEMGWGSKGSRNIDPSRNAKAIAKIIKPDGIADTD